MGNDHFIPKCLTRPWRDRKRGGRLRVFDFDSRKIEDHDDDDLFARAGINAPETEAYFNRLIETPFAVAQRQMRAARGDIAAVKKAFDELPRAALVGLYFLQGQRIADALHLEKDVERLHADDIAKKGTSFLEELAQVVFSQFEAVLYGLGSDHHAFFPSTATFPVPLRRRPVMGLAVDTNYVLVFIPRDGSRHEVDQLMTQPGIATALSIGTNRARKVLVPPRVGVSENDGPGVEMLRAVNLKLLRGYALASQAHDEDPWQILD